MGPLSVPGPLVSADWLAERLGHPELVALDASVGPYRGAERRIPGARVFDLDGALSDQASPLPHTMPDPEALTRELRALGVGDRSAVVAYDGSWSEWGLSSGRPVVTG
ncbi:hypothetical protein ACIGXM_05480 [Kitasatospora sp. NPDC052896]|uniref:hypothetical protein n=1 Tax=Kitasatospora sp. NPDC052896 TaxID=3364061 RepID=UPI0037CC3D16